MEFPVALWNLAEDQEATQYMHPIHVEGFLPEAGPAIESDPGLDALSCEEMMDAGSLPFCRWKGTYQMPKIQPQLCSIDVEGFLPEVDPSDRE